MRTLKTEQCEDSRMEDVEQATEEKFLIVETKIGMATAVP